MAKNKTTDTPMRNMRDALARHTGEKVVVICARYQYWGTVSEVLEDCLILSNAYAVESSGSAQGEQPSVTDAIPESIVISLGAVELMYRPKWIDFEPAATKGK